MKAIRAILSAALLAGTAAAARQDGTPPAPPPAPAADAPLPVEVFAELPAFVDPRLSPDGTHILGRMAVRGRQALVVRALAAGGAVHAIAANDDLDINWYRWVGNDWIAVGVGSQTTLYGTETYITRTLGVSADMARLVRVDWPGAGLRADDMLWHARDGTPRILLSRQTGIDRIEQYYPEVVEANLATGRVRRVVAGRADVWDWYADGAGQVRAGYRYNDNTRRGELIYRAAPDQPFRSVAVRRKGDDHAITIPLIFRADGSAIATDDSDGFDAVYELSLPDLALGRKLFGTPGYDVDGVISTATDDDLAGISVTEAHSRIHWLDPRLKELQGLADNAAAPRRARLVSWNDDRTRFLVQVGTPSQAGALFVWDINAGRMQRLAWNNDSLKGRTLSPVRTVRYPARDGTMIEAVLTLPRHRTPRNLPLIVLPHGGPFARDAEEWDWWVQYLAEIGYAVIQPNYRGSSGYGRAFGKLGEGQWGLKMQDDLNDALAWAAQQGIADPKRVCMVGASYGGYAAMRAAQRDGALYRCAISYAGVSDLGAMRAYDGQFLFGKTRGDWLKAQAPDFRSVSPRFSAASFGAPILLVHGKADKRVPIKQSRVMAAALREAGKPYDYVEQPLADHHFTRGEDRLEFLKAMKAFLDRYNPA